MKKHKLHPESLALSLGYKPELSEWAVKPPVFLTSTFQFESAESGKRFFELAYGLKKKKKNEDPGLIYSRINNPNLQIFEERLAAWDEHEQSATFSSGMSAISTVMLALLEPGSVVLTSSPVYGGSHYLFQHILPKFKIEVHSVEGGDHTASLMLQKAEQLGFERVKMLYVETPANPSNVLIDLAAIDQARKTIEQNANSSKKASRKQSEKHRVITACDNTFLGPLYQRPARQGIDLVIYSATKFIGGHSDLIAGVVSGPADLMKTIADYRTILGTMNNPFTGWLLLRSLETLSIRMRRQQKNAKALVELLAKHPAVSSVSYPGYFDSKSNQAKIFRAQCEGSGSLIGFEVKGGESAAFRVLNAFRLCRLAVSLGGTETLVEHPMSMTHSDVPPDALNKMGVGPGFIRMSVGIEHVDDLKADLEYALSFAGRKKTSSQQSSKRPKKARD